jgi:large subunit ribosomal protein L21
MYAVILTGGKQYKVDEGATVFVEKIEGEKGASVVLDQVLLLGGKDKPDVGRPTVKGASVTVEILSQERSEKVVVYKRRRRKGFQKLRGHRQPFTSLKVVSIKQD